MMLLKHIYLYLNLDEYSPELATPFGFKTRYLCNFMERHLRRAKFHAQGFSKICIQGRHQPLESCPIVSENAALPTISFDQSRYESLKPGDHHEFFIEMLVAGLEKCARYHQIPFTELMATIEEFRRGGYRNEWVHQKRRFHSPGLQASLLCRLDAEGFCLTLKLETNGVTILERPILETKPDEIIFSHRFDTLVMEGGALVVKDKFGKSTFSMSVDSLGLR